MTRQSDLGIDMTPRAIGTTAATRRLESLDERVDHVRGPAGSALILEYGDYECPYSRRAYREIQHVESELQGDVRGIASGEVRGTPTLFIDGVVHRGPYDAGDAAGGASPMTREQI